MACATCRTCRGPVRAGFARCYQCDLAGSQAGSLLADAVAPIGYAVKGGELARDLWLYKSGRPDAAGAQDRLRQLLAAFLRDHGPAVWRAAGMRPGVVAVVPSGQGRPGDHPLLRIVQAVTPLPVVPVCVRAGSVPRGRIVSTGWLSVHGQVTGENVLLVDDTWVSGASAQSAAAALKLAGAARVAVIVLGRHVDPADPRSADLIRTLAAEGQAL